MNNKKIKTIAGGSFIVFIVIGFVVSSYRTTHQPSMPTQQIPALNVGRDTISFPLEFRLEEEISIPETLPTYRVGMNQSSAPSPQSIASSFGLNFEPEKLNDINQGVVYVWSSAEGDYLRIAPSTNTMDYKFFPRYESTSTTFSDEISLISVAEQELARLDLIGNAFNFESIKYIDFEDYTYEFADNNDAAFAQVRFIETINGYPVINTSPGIGSISVLINKDSEIYGIYIDSLGDMTESSTYTIKSLQEIKESSKSESVLISIGDETIDPLDFPINQISRIFIENINLAYLKNINQSDPVIRPIFVLKGTLITINNERTSATLYLQAIK